MDFKLITSEHNCPYRLSVIEGAVQESHFHNYFELIMVLRGEIDCTLAGRSYTLGSRDFIFINPYELYSINQIAENTNLITLEIDRQFYKPLFAGGEQVFFKWDETCNNRELDFYVEIAEAVRSIIMGAINQEPAYLARIGQEVMGILIAIYNQCGQVLSASKKLPQLTSQTQKAAEIMEYLSDHYMEPLSLQSVSAAVHITPQYISRLFKGTFGVGFLEYLNRLRVQKSLHALKDTSDYILDIAMSVGFNNAKTYGRVFTQIMGETPSKYRAGCAMEKDEMLPAPEGEGQMSHLLGFLSEKHMSGRMLKGDLQYDTVSINQDFTGSRSRQYSCRWNRTVSVGMAALLLRQNVQREVLDAVRDLDFKYVRITGVLSDDLQIYQEQVDGSPVYFWVLLDEVLDFMRRNNLKPFISIGFMPEKLAARSVPSPYYWNANTSKPKSMRQWKDYLYAFLQHCIGRYSYDEVCTWKFEFWNAPELKGLFWHDSDRDFQKFFLASYEAFRMALPDGLFGSPGFVKFNRFAYTRKFLEFCIANNVRFDFVCLHIFMITDPDINDPHLKHIMPLEPDKDMQTTQYLNHTIMQFSQLLSELEMDAPIYITEWNISPYQQDLSRDTCFMGTYIADSINKLPDVVDEIAFWALTDYMEEHTPHQEMFVGELGLKTNNGLPKPSYLAFILLHRMQERLFASGDGYMITGAGNSYQILLYNHVFYSREFLNGESHKLTELDRYQIYESANEKRFQLHLILPSGTYRIERHILDREHGSIYDIWLRMGTPRYVDTSVYRFLNNKAYPDINIRHQTVEEHLLLSEFVPVHGIELLLLTRVEQH